MESEAIGLDALSDIEFLELIIRQFGSRPSLQLVLGVVQDRDGKDILLSTMFAMDDDLASRELRTVANRLESEGTTWTQLVKKPD